MSFKWNLYFTAVPPNCVENSTSLSSPVNGSVFGKTNTTCSTLPAGPNRILEGRSGDLPLAESVVRCMRAALPWDACANAGGSPDSSIKYAELSSRYFLASGDVATSVPYLRRASACLTGSALCQISVNPSDRSLINSALSEERRERATS